MWEERPYRQRLHLVVHASEETRMLSLTPARCTFLDLGLWMNHVALARVSTTSWRTLTVVVEGIVASSMTAVLVDVEALRSLEDASSGLSWPWPMDPIEADGRLRRFATAVAAHCVLDNGASCTYLSMALLPHLPRS